MVSVYAASVTLSARAQLDSAAAASIITSSLAASLRAPRIPHSSGTLAWGEGTTSYKHKVSVTLVSNQGEEIECQCVVLPNIVPTLSQANYKQIRQMGFLHGLPLADPLYQPGCRIDMLLEMGISTKLTRDGRVTSPDGYLEAQRTIFGWTVAGTQRVNEQFHPPLGSSTIHLITTVSVSARRKQNQVEKVALALSLDELRAVRHFDQTVSRDQDGVYVTKFPRPPHPPQLGHSRNAALKRFLGNESSLRRKGTLQA